MHITFRDDFPGPPDSSEIEDDIDYWEEVNRLFRAPLLVIVFLFFVGLNIWGWKESDIDCHSLLKVGPKTTELKCRRMMLITAILGKD